MSDSLDTEKMEESKEEKDTRISEVKGRKDNPSLGDKDGLSQKEDTCMSFVCPVCGKSVSEPHLPNVQSVIKEGLYFVQKTRIVNSKVVFEHEFVHSYDEEEDIGLEESHDVIAVISTEFDGKGECTVFDILEIRPCDIGGSTKENIVEGRKTIRR